LSSISLSRRSLSCEAAIASLVAVTSLATTAVRGSALASALIGLAALAAEQGLAARAVRLCSAAQARYAAARSQFSQIDQQASDAALALARPALDPASYARAWADGQALTAEQAASEALATAD
jgi:hypothetical protein